MRDSALAEHGLRSRLAMDAAREGDLMEIK